MDLCQYVRLLGKRKAYTKLFSEADVDRMLGELERGTYRFSSMSRFDVPKPNKPGQVRPITKPADEDRFVFGALLELLHEYGDSKFSEHSHGFRPGRGAGSFFREVNEWPPLDRAIQCDFVKCFERIDPPLLLSFLRTDFFPDRLTLVDLIEQILKVPIIDSNVKTCNVEGLGIPQGCPISPILLNLFLHRFDQMLGKLQYLSTGERFFYWVRYADDLLFGFPKKKEGAWTYPKPENVLYPRKDESRPFTHTKMPSCPMCRLIELLPVQTLPGR